ncbi:hypothetical protein FY133_00460 [Agrobacterium tumefaciens]|uniref:hypothetical protein n=1 Tax=Agrobacterium tumefaciens TaxID=358 RepID=UPI0021D22677|nr:hypothetical protein [Agrobacterium tumefaciens]UXT64125.1 hypothetical protein FY133_00460 [Agrobacterium tumefaciens]
MFSKDDYLCCDDVLGYAFRSAVKKDRSALDWSDDQYNEIRYSQFWSFAMSNPAVFVLLPSGEVVKGSFGLISPKESKGSCGHFLSLTTGRLGGFVSGESPYISSFRVTRWLSRWIPPLEALLDTYELIIARRFAKEWLGPFWGASVMFCKEDVETFFFPPEADPEEEPIVQGSEEDILAMEIISGFDNGVFGRKEDAKEIIAPKARSARAFLRAWDRAASLRPDISRPGRRGLNLSTRND